jgi:CO/xanthine dehydrogenase Mo-binding subunit
MINRRDFLKSSTSGGLFIAFSLLAPTGRADAGQTAAQRWPSGAEKAAAAPGAPDAAKLDAWLAIHPDNTATLFTGKVDVGTGAQTALGQIAAEELDFPIDRLDVVMGTTSSTVDQGTTYGSMTIRAAGPQIQHAAAAGRAVLLDMAADHFKLPASQLETHDGAVRVVGDPSRTVTYGALTGGRRLDVEIGATGTQFGMKVAPKAVVKDPSTYTVVGRSIPRKDIPGKVTGAFTYIQDVRVPGMLHGRVVRPYGLGATLVSVDESGLKDIPGFLQVVRRGNFLGVVAENEWAAIQAAAKLGSQLNPGGPDNAGARWSEWSGLPAMTELSDTLRKAPGRNGSVATRGSVDIALGTAAQKVQATYFTPFQMHGTLGPSCAIADVQGQRATFWSGTQMPHQTRSDMAVLLGIPEENIEVRWVEAAGGYGRNGLEHAVADAALMSQAVGKPVRVQWMRWDEHGWEPKGPAIVQDLVGAVDASGNVVAWRHHMWVPTTGDTHLIAADLIGKPIGRTGQGRGSVSYMYTFDNADVAFHGEGRVALLTAWLRSPAQFETTFAMESFVDELAALAKEDPLTFRLKYLEDRRAIGVLQAAADTFGWKSRPAGSQAQAGGDLARGRGLAWVERDGTYVAAMTDLTVNRRTGEIRLGRVVVAHDCGLVINPDGMKNQIEGNIIQSLSRTLHEEVTFDQARVTSRDWRGYPILRFTEIPDKIDIVLVNNRPEYAPSGGGEPSTCQTAAMIGNAVFDATGVRLRQTPFRPERVKAAIGA